MAIGIGLAVNNARAVIEALIGKQTEFARTPKYGVEREGDEWASKKYTQVALTQPLIEVPGPRTGTVSRPVGTTARCRS
jgi:hypothetical protein